MNRWPWMDWHPDPRDEELEERALESPWSGGAQWMCWGCNRFVDEAAVENCVACGDAGEGGFRGEQDSSDA